GPTICDSREEIGTPPSPPGYDAGTKIKARNGPMRTLASPSRCCAVAHQKGHYLRLRDSGTAQGMLGGTERLFV
ncbi:MAG: hypothetical protein U1A06_19040, partial [Hoeflea sp.]|nr:hypothetical protein [Hoeflea sp.]